MAQDYTRKSAVVHPTNQLLAFKVIGGAAANGATVIGRSLRPLVGAGGDVSHCAGGWSGARLPVIRRAAILNAAVRSSRRGRGGAGPEGAGL